MCVLREAIASADEAMRAFTYRGAPMRWAMCQELRAAALAAIGENDRNVAPLREAVTTYGQAISVFRAKGADARLRRTITNLEEAEQALRSLSPAE